MEAGGADRVKVVVQPRAPYSAYRAGMDEEALAREAKVPSQFACVQIRLHA